MQNRHAILLSLLGSLLLCFAETGCDADNFASENEGENERSDWIVISSVSGRWGNSTRSSVCEGYVIVDNEYALSQSGTAVGGSFTEQYESGPAFQSSVSGEYDKASGVLTLHYQERIQDCDDTSTYRSESVTKQFKFTSNTEMHWVNGNNDIETFTKR